MKSKKELLMFLVVFFFLFSCLKKGKEPVEEIVPEVPAKSFHGFQKPAHFPDPVYDFASNPIEQQKFKLGRMLFYDPILSADSCISCATCHQQSVAFTHMNHTLSHGINGLPGTRNSPSLANLAWSKEFMWDGGIPNLEIQPLAPIENHVEMGETLSNVLKKLNRHPLYKPRFKDAFGKDSINSQQMLKALAQFMVMLVSSNSKYDQYVQGKATLNQDELDGLKIVQNKCASCHSGVLFSDFDYHNIGLDSTIIFDTDLGREQSTKLKSDRRKFKTPSLRNMTITKPFMHDGRVLDLKNCIEKHGEFDSPNIAPELKQFVENGLKLSNLEYYQIFQFISTLTDNQFISDTTFSLKASDFYPYSITPVQRCSYVH